MECLSNLGFATSFALTVQHNLKRTVSTELQVDCVRGSPAVPLLSSTPGSLTKAVSQQSLRRTWNVCNFGMFADVCRCLQHSAGMNMASRKTMLRDKVKQMSNCLETWVTESQYMHCFNMPRAAQ